MVHHEIHGDEGLDHLRIATEARNRGTHRGEIDEEGDAGEVLEDDAGHDERNFNLLGALAFQLARAFTSSGLTFLPSQFRSTDSRTIRMLIGRREIGPIPCFSRAGSE